MCKRGKLGDIIIIFIIIRRYAAACSVITSLVPLCRQCVTYSCLPTTKDQDGLVALHIGTSAQANLQNQWSSIRSTILQLAGSQVVDVVLEGVRPLPDNCSEMTIYLLQKSALGSTDRISAHTVYTFLQQYLVRNVLLQYCPFCGVVCMKRLQAIQSEVFLCVYVYGWYCNPSVLLDISHYHGNRVISSV